MNNTQNTLISREQLLAYTKIIAMPLKNEEADAAVALLDNVIPQAIELSSSMQAFKHNSITPITVYSICADVIEEIS